MIGKTNCKAAHKLPCEFINITLLTNQSSHEDLIGATFTVSYGNFSKDYVWDGNEVTVEIPAYLEYRVSFSEVNGYKSPDAVANAAVVGNSRNITGVYRTSLLTVALEDNQSSYDDIAVANAAVVGNSVNTTVANGGTIKVPMGETVTITGTEVSGYSIPSTTYTADAPSKSVVLTYATEILTVNVSGASGGYTVSVKKSDGTVLDSQTTSSKTYKIPFGTQYYVEGSAVTDYTTPAKTSTYTAGSGSNASRSVSMVYELSVETLTVNVSGISSGYTVSVINASTGATIGSQTTASKTYKIPNGIKYYVKGASVKGYIAPSNSSTYTAVAGQTRSVTMKYVVHAGTLNPTNGVYIQDTDGYFHTESEWTNTYKPNGIALIDTQFKAVMALKNAYSEKCIWGSLTLVSGITTITSYAAGVGGEVFTEKIIEQLGADSAQAASYCKNYKFPNGKSGFLGEGSEWRFVIDNMESVISALEKCGGDTIRNTTFWTGCQYDEMKAWTAHVDDNFSNNDFYDTYKYDKHYTRAFCSL